MAIGAVIASSGIATILVGAFDALSGPELRVKGEDWIRDKAEVLNIGTPADPFLRVFAPGSKMVRVVFGETHGGAFLGNERTLLVTAEQVAANNLADGTILLAWMDPADEYNAILDLERTNPGSR